MTKEINRIPKISLDSFLMFVPLEKVTILKDELLDTIQAINTTTSEVLSEYTLAKQEAFNIAEIANEPFSCYIKLITKKVAAGNKGIVEKNYLSITINSKLLKEDYLKGITSETIEKVYNTIISFGWFTVDYKDFLNSIISDVDFKVDTVFNSQEEVSEHLKKLCYNITSYYKLHAKLTSRKDNEGLQIGHRSNMTITFCKWYNKTKELIHSSSTFNEKYVRHYPDKEVILRFEFTLASKKAFKDYNLLLDNELLTLGKCLCLTQIQLEEVYKRIISERISLSNLITEDRINELSEIVPAPSKLSHKDAKILFGLFLKFLVDNNGIIDERTINFYISLVASLKPTDTGCKRKKYTQALALVEFAKNIYYKEIDSETFNI